MAYHVSEPKRSEPIKKLLESAVANAKNKSNVESASAYRLKRFVLIKVLFIVILSQGLRDERQFNEDVYVIISVILETKA